MLEEIKIRDVYGYDTLIRDKDRDEFVALRGKGVRELKINMDVVLEGNIRGYVSTGFTDGEGATIVKFREPPKEGSFDEIVLAINGNKTKDWIKPSNIKNRLNP